jgi:hypothetical protein
MSLPTREHPAGIIGIPGRLRSESVAGLDRNRWPSSSECALVVSQQRHDEDRPNPRIQELASQWEIRRRFEVGDLHRPALPRTLPKGGCIAQTQARPADSLDQVRFHDAWGVPALRWPHVVRVLSVIGQARAQTLPAQWCIDICLAAGLLAALRGAERGRARPRPPATGKVYRRLGSCYAGAASEWPSKPPWMRWKTYQRLCAKVQENEEALDRAFAPRIASLIAKYR